MFTLRKCLIPFLVLILITGTTQAESGISPNFFSEEERALREIAIHSQSVVKNYFYLQNNLNTSMATREMEKSLKRIDQNLYFLDKAIRDDELQGIVNFIAIIVNDLKEAVTQDYDQDSALLALDMSDVILEATESISDIMSIEAIPGTGLLKTLENQSFLIERMTKLYIASYSGFKDYNTSNQIKKAVAEYEQGLREIEEHHHSNDLVKHVQKLRERWEITKRFYSNVDHAELPKTVFYSTAVMEKCIGKLTRYEYKVAQSRLAKM